MEAVGYTIIYGFVLGSMYLMISLGFSLICGVLGIFNLGYGATFLVSIYGIWLLMTTFGLKIWLAIIGVFFLQIAFTLWVIYYPIVLKFIDKEELLLTSLLLVSLIVEETVNHFYPVTAGVDIPTTIIPGSIKIGTSTVPNQLVLAAFCSVIITLFFVIFLTKTRIGFKIRALSQDKDAATLLGVKVKKVYALAMILSVIPPTICMIIIAPVWAIEPGMGASLLQIAILVTILGGLGNLRGTVMASFIVGMISSAVAFFLNPRLVGMVVLIIVFFVLIYKPQGIAKSETIW